MNLCFCEDVEKGSVLSFFRWERFSSLCFSQRIYFSFCFFNVIAVIFNIISYLAIVLNLLRLFIWRDSVSLYDLPQTSDFNKTNSIRLIEFVVSSSYISSYTKLIWKLHRLVYFIESVDAQFTKLCNFLIAVFILFIPINGQCIRWTARFLCRILSKKNHCIQVNTLISVDIIRILCNQVCCVYTLTINIQTTEKWKGNDCAKVRSWCSKE